MPKKILEYQWENPKYASFFIKSLKLTELVSRVLYSCEQPSSIFTVRHRTVQAKSSATMRVKGGQPIGIAESQGVASDRVYSKPMLP